MSGRALSLVFQLKKLRLRRGKVLAWVTQSASHRGRARTPTRSGSSVWLALIREERNWEFRKRKDKVGGSIIQSFAKSLGEMKEVKTEARFSVSTVHLELCSFQLQCDAIMGRAKNIHASGWEEV